jgi:UDP-N-acetyl-D-galactosamine dehydrogenase
MDFKCKVGVIGLGYVGLPLIMTISQKHQAIGYDISASRITELEAKIDHTGEIQFKEYPDRLLPKFTNIIDDLAECNFYIVTVPTPVTKHNVPDLSALTESCKSLGRILQKGDIVVFESTVYPGATEEICVPELEKSSLLTYNKDFYVGYSPERINPGDKTRRVSDIVKVTSGSTAQAAVIIDEFYASIIDAGTYMAPSIIVAEAAKVIENIQRDVNIALINELSMLFKKLNIDTHSVLDAANTKWNFLNFRPGLVGGHCIGVDPYYLTYKAMAVGHNPNLILAGRRINDEMASNCVRLFLNELIKKNLLQHNKRVLILGYTFKENCPDVRNTKVTTIVEELTMLDFEVDVYDPNIVCGQIIDGSFPRISEIKRRDYIGCIVAVAHQEFITKGALHYRQHLIDDGLLFDVKGCFKMDESDLRL